MLRKIKLWKKIKQQSKQWFSKRKKIITASDVSSILESNPFTSKYTIFNNKITEDNLFTGNDATEWGNVHEPYAKEIYSNKLLPNGNKKIYDVGLVIHNKYDWLGASPDGIVQFTDNNKWCILEIKCPYRRSFKNKGEKIPNYIWIQTQIQMEVCNLPFCHLFQCKFNSESKIPDYTRLTTIYRDKKWFSEYAFPLLLEFKKNIEKSKKYLHFKNPYLNPDEWTYAKSFKGFLLQDPILDWLNMYKYNKTIQHLRNRYSVKKDNNINNKFMVQSLLDNMKKCATENKKSYIEIADFNEKFNTSFSTTKFNMTINSLKNNIDLIINPVILNYDQKIYGTPDIIISASFLSILFETNVYGFKKIYNKHFIDNNKYVILSIKNYKLLTNKLGKIDKINKIIYSSYLTTVNKITKSKNILGQINSTNCSIINPIFMTDNDVIKLQKGSEWVKDIRKNGKKWIDNLYSDNLPENKNIMPNMCNKNDTKWRGIKKYLALKWGELTLLWYCGISNRKNAFNNNIYSWKLTDKDNVVKAIYNTNTTSFNVSKRKNIIKSMIYLNKQNSKAYTSRNFGDIIEPYDNCDNSLEVFIDFEVLSGYKTSRFINNRQKTYSGFIYLIGMFWKCPTTNKFLFNSFHSENRTLLSEKEMIKEWWRKVVSLKKKNKSDRIILYHWSQAEDIFLKKAFKRNNLHWIKSDLASGEYELRDLMEMYIDDEVTIKNVWNYSLKHTARGLFDLGLIPEIWDSYDKGGDIMNGYQSITTANKCYQYSKNTNTPISTNYKFLSIVKYNETDCKVLYYLLLFLRKYIYSSDKRTIRKIKRNNKRILCFTNKKRKN